MKHCGEKDARAKQADKRAGADDVEEGELHAKIVKIFRDYNDVIGQAGPPYNFG